MATTLSKEMLEAHPAAAQVDRDLLARCIDECLACLQSCTACADADLAEEDVAEMRRCIRLCLDCGGVVPGALRDLRRGVRAPRDAPRALPALRRGVQALRAGLLGGAGRNRIGN